MNEVENLFFHQLQAREAAAAQEAKKAAVLASLNTSSVPLPKTLPPDAAARSRADEIYKRHSGGVANLPMSRVSPPLQGSSSGSSSSGNVPNGPGSSDSSSSSGNGQSVLAAPFNGTPS